ncbi:MAG: hypothetical protein V8S74_07760 [Lachnospirales bacterium]
MKRYEKPQANMMTFKNQSTTNANQNETGTFASTVPTGVGTATYGNKLKGID